MMTDTIPTPNIPLLRKAVEWVEEQAALEGKGRWFQDAYYVRVQRPAQQGDFYCGTAACVAGYVALLDGWKPEFTSSGRSTFTTMVRKGDEYEAVRKVAEQLLGLYPHQAVRLFHAGNSARTIRTIAEEIAGERL